MKQFCTEGRDLRIFRKVAAVFGCALLLASTPAARAQRAPADITPILSALRAEDFAGVLRLCKIALAKSPGDYRVWTLKGMATARMNRLPDALESYKHALRLSPDYLPAMEGVAQTEFQLGRPAAYAQLERILVRRPDDPATHALLGILDARANKCESAVAHFEKARSVLSRQLEAQADHGFCLAALHRDDEAIDAFAAVAASAPSSVPARYNLALAQWNSHRADDALQTLQPLIEGDAPSPDALTLAAEIVESKDETARAVSLLRRALMADPKCMEAYLGFATLSYDHASPQVGVDMINVGLVQLPREPRLYLVRGILLTQSGEFARAADDFAEASRLNPHLQFLAVAEGLVESQQHHSALALAQFRAAVKAHPKDAMAHYLLAEALNGEGKQAGSAEYAEEFDAATAAVRLDPSFVAARDLLASIYLESDKTQDAIAQSKAALALKPADQQAMYHLIVALRKAGEKEQIPDLLKRLMQLRADPQAQHDHAKRYRLYVEHQAEP